jgi:mono/diheme cytochrome c family protein
MSRFLVSALFINIFLLTACGGGAIDTGSSSSAATSERASSETATSEKSSKDSVPSSAFRSSTMTQKSSAKSVASAMKSSAAPSSTITVIRSSLAASVKSSSSAKSSVVSSKSSSSRASRGRSHNAGKNCLSCHKVGGSGTGVFTAAGTVYRSNGAVQIDATVRLFTHGTNTEVINILTDDSGNFHTTKPISGLSNGLDAVVESAKGGMISMGKTVSTGGCNACHNGTVTDKITID